MDSEDSLETPTQGILETVHIISLKSSNDRKKYRFKSTWGMEVRD